ncbi:hypothetical protein MC885_013374 [Smutsia gigantea]|nr:hypothetical protein MC885_013374 [Smutsia gigantea]
MARAKRPRSPSEGKTVPGGAPTGTSTSEEPHWLRPLLLTRKAAAMTLRTVLLSLQALLAAAEPDDPQDAVVANQYKQNPEMFKQTARLWAHVYAGAPVSSPEYTKKIENLCAMGFDRNAVIVALSSKSWDVETATELLLSN